ncbi:hypothetical protein PHISP_04140 [Aspergillus sp. HF37]|nr:hypothetical protein PHISP_04140 [Aspergillus sp. HF37]
MTYKSNFEPYVSRSPDITDDPAMPSYDEAFDPLGSLYPYVTALQRQSNPGYFIGYNPAYSWAEAYTTQPPLEEENPRPSLRRMSDISGRRFVSKLRRILGRDEARGRPHSTSSAPR